MSLPGPRRLLLMRHATAEPVDDGDDRLRALSPRGRREAAEVGRRLAAHRLLPDLVLCSDADRALQTWECAAVGASAAGVPVQQEPRLYEASPASVVYLIAEVTPEVGAVLVVGHQPTLSQVAAALSGSGSDLKALARVRSGLAPAGVAVLETDGSWSLIEGGSCRLVDVWSAP